MNTFVNIYLDIYISVNRNQTPRCDQSVTKLRALPHSSQGGPGAGPRGLQEGSGDTA